MKVDAALNVGVVADHPDLRIPDARLVLIVHSSSLTTLTCNSGSRPRKSALGRLLFVVGTKVYPAFDVGVIADDAWLGMVLGEFDMGTPGCQMGHDT